MFSIKKASLIRIEDGNCSRAINIQSVAEVYRKGGMVKILYHCGECRRFDFESDAEAQHFFEQFCSFDAEGEW